MFCTAYQSYKHFIINFRCAAEHGRMDIIKILLASPDCDSTIQDLVKIYT